MQIKFKTVKVDGENLLHLVYKEIDGKNTAKCEKDPEQPVHPDLTKSMAKLKPHFALLCEQLETPSNINSLTDEQLENFTVRGFHHSNNEEIPGVTIVGHKILKSGKVLGLNAPFIRFYADAGEANAYPFQEHLETILGEVEFEAEQYLGGKFRPDPQPELPFGQPNGDKSKTTVEVLDAEEGSAFETDKPKRGRKKKEVVTE